MDSYDDPGFYSDDDILMSEYENAEPTLCCWCNLPATTDLVTPDDRDPVRDPACDNHAWTYAASYARTEQR